eukprot:7378447-Prymnesium_polylepis.1
MVCCRSPLKRWQVARDVLSNRTALTLCERPRALWRVGKFSLRCAGRGRVDSLRYLSLIAPGVGASIYTIDWDCGVPRAGRGGGARASRPHGIQGGARSSVTQTQGPAYSCAFGPFKGP